MKIIAQPSGAASASAIISAIESDPAAVRAAAEAVGLSGNETVAGNKTLSGQLELTGQSATNATSAMTRGLGDTRYGGPIYDLDGAATHSESAATTPIKTVVLPVGTYLIEEGKLHASHADGTSRTINVLLNFSGGTATIQDRGLISHSQASVSPAFLTYSGSGASLTSAVSIMNGAPAFGAGAHYFRGRIVVTAQTTLQIFGFCSVTPTNAIAYETSGILRKIA